MPPKGNCNTSLQVSVSFHDSSMCRYPSTAAQQTFQCPDYSTSHQEQLEWPITLASHLNVYPISDPCHTAGEKRTTFLASYESEEVDDSAFTPKGESQGISQISVSHSIRRCMYGLSGYQLPMHSFLLLSIQQNSFSLRYRMNIPNVDHGSKHIYWVRAEVNYQIRSLCSNQENINPQTQTPQLPQLDHLCTLFFDEALAFLPLGGIALCHTDLDVSKRPQLGL